ARDSQRGQKMGFDAPAIVQNQGRSVVVPHSRGKRLSFWTGGFSPPEWRQIGTVRIKLNRLWQYGWKMNMAPKTPSVTAFFEERTSSLQYVAADPATGKCAIIDPVLDYDEKSGAVATRSADAILEFVKREGLEVEWILDTHPHADHFSAAAYLKQKTGAPTA